MQTVKARPLFLPTSHTDIYPPASVSPVHSVIRAQVDINNPCAGASPSAYLSSVAAAGVVAAVVAIVAAAAAAADDAANSYK